MKALSVNTIKQEIDNLEFEIKREKNVVEKKRLLEDQASLKRTLRLIPAKDVTLKIRA